MRSQLVPLSITLIAVAIFMAVRVPLGMQFGLRTYWPIFFVGYLVLWYFWGLIHRKGGDEKGRI
jgi:hypothetical protein